MENEKLHLYKITRSPYFYYRFMVNGKVYRGSTKRTNQTDAKRVMVAEYNRVMDIRQHGEKPEITITEAMERTVETVTGATRESYQNSMNKLLCLRPRFRDAGLWSLDGSRLLHTLTDADLEDHVDARQSEGFKANSINIEIRFLKRVNNLSRKRYKANPDLDFQMLEGFVKCRSLSMHEERAVIAYCLDKTVTYDDATAWQKAHDLFIYLVDTGVRLHEATKVEWNSIDMEDRLIDNWNYKTKKAVFVPISDRLYEVLARLHNQVQPFISMDRAIKNLRTAITDMCPSSPRVLAEQGKATIHSCRDTYATRMLNKGLSLGEVSHLLGHASIAQTQKYAKYDKKDMADKARRLLNGG